MRLLALAIRTLGLVAAYGEARQRLRLLMLRAALLATALLSALVTLGFATFSVYGLLQPVWGDAGTAASIGGFYLLVTLMLLLAASGMRRRKAPPALNFEALASAEGPGSARFRSASGRSTSSAPLLIAIGLLAAMVLSQDTREPR